MLIAPTFASRRPIRRWSAGLAVVFVLGLVGGPSGAAEIATPKALDDRLGIELFAAEPDVVTVTGLTVDSQGRVLVVESQNRKTGLGSRFGSQLLRRGLHPAYDHLGVTEEGVGGLWQQIPHQGLDPDSIIAKVRELAG